MARMATGMLLSLLGGCMFQSLSAPQRLNESSFVLNDAARWGRLDVAQGMVDAEYQALYRTRHQDWGSRIQIAESDVVSLQLDEDKDGAQTLVKVSWYSTDTMSLHASTILQRWRADGQDYLLVDEQLQGDTALFAEADPEDAPPTESTREGPPDADAIAPAPPG